MIPEGHHPDVVKAIRQVVAAWPGKELHFHLVYKKPTEVVVQAYGKNNRRVDRVVVSLAES